MAEKTKWCGKNQVRAPQEATGTGTCTINSHLISGTFSSNHSGLRQTVSVGELHRWSGRGRRENTGLCKTSRRHHIITLQVELRGPTATRGLRLLLSARKPPPTDARRLTSFSWHLDIRAASCGSVCVSSSAAESSAWLKHYLNLPFMSVALRLQAVSFVNAAALSVVRTPPGGAKAPYMWQAGRAQKVLMRGALKQTEHLLRACYVLLYTVFTHDNVLNISPAAKNKDRLDLVCTWHAGLPTTTPMCSIDGAIMRTHTSVHASH